MSTVTSWKRDTRPYTTGSLYRCGPWVVGGYHYDACRSKDDPKKYAATCKLPGIKPLLGHYEKQDEAKAVVERAVAHWMKRLEEPAPAEAKA